MSDEEQRGPGDAEQLAQVAATLGRGPEHFAADAELFQRIAELEALAATETKLR